MDFVVLSIMFDRMIKIRGMLKARSILEILLFDDQLLLLLFS